MHNSALTGASTAIVDELRASMGHAAIVPIAATSGVVVVEAEALAFSSAPLLLFASGAVNPMRSKIQAFAAILSSFALGVLAAFATTIPPWGWK